MIAGREIDLIQTFQENMVQSGLGQLKDSLGRMMQYCCKGGRLSDVVHMDQGVTHYEYDERGVLVCAIDQVKVTYLRNEEDHVG